MVAETENAKVVISKATKEEKEILSYKNADKEVVFKYSDTPITEKVIEGETWFKKGETTKKEEVVTAETLRAKEIEKLGFDVNDVMETDLYKESSDFVQKRSIQKTKQALKKSLNPFAKI